MKRIVTILFLCGFIGSISNLCYAQKEKNIGFGVGFQREGLSILGISVIDPLCGISGRCWITPVFGIQGVMNFGSVKLKEEEEEHTLSASMQSIKALFKLAEDENFAVYIGGGLERVKFKYEEENYEDWEDERKGTGYEVFGGMEWYFQKLPNIRFNTEVGYWRLTLEDDENNGELTLNGFIVGRIGVHYYF